MLENAGFVGSGVFVCSALCSCNAEGIRCQIKMVVVNHILTVSFTFWHLFYSANLVSMTTAPGAWESQELTAFSPAVF